jgi:hypothetical protein
MGKTLLTGLLMLAPVHSWSAEPPASEQRPLVEVQVQFEMAAIEASVAQASQSVADMAASLEQIARNEVLTPEQQAQLAHTVANVDQLAEATRHAVEALPTLVQRSREELSAQGRKLLADIKFWFFVALAVTVAGLAVVLFCVYWFVLRPLQAALLEATGNIAGMAQAMESTARSLEVSNQTHREILQLAGKLQQDRG